MNDSNSPSNNIVIQLQDIEIANSSDDDMSDYGINQIRSNLMINIKDDKFKKKMEYQFGRH